MSDQSVDFNTVLRGLDGTPIVLNSSEDGGETKELRLGDVAVGSLMFPTEGKVDGKTKLERFNLALKIRGAGDDDDSYETLTLPSLKKTLILKLAADIYSTLVYARAHEALEGTTDGEDD